MTRARAGWRPLFEWALAFGLLALAAIGVMSIGIFIFPMAIAALLYADRRNRTATRTELLCGGLLGVSAVCLFIAYRNRGYVPCPPSGVTVRLGRGQHFRCGGSDPLPWLAVGVVLAAAGLIGYLLFRRAHRATAA